MHIPPQVVQGMLEKVGAVLTNDHFVYTSDRHGNAYINKDLIYPHTYTTKQLALVLAQSVAHLRNLDTVIAPATGGVILSQWVAYHLSGLICHEVMAVYAEKEQVVIPDPENKGRKCFAETGAFVIKRGYEAFVKDKQVLVVEDILNTGGTVKKVVETVQRSGGHILAVAAICNRGRVQPQDIGTPPVLLTLLDMPLESWSPQDPCPLCERQVPINTQVGKGAEFLARQEVL